MDNHQYNLINSYHCLQDHLDMILITLFFKHMFINKLEVCLTYPGTQEQFQ